MSFFTVDHSEAGSFQPLTPGEYEAIISKIEKKQSQNGNDMLFVTLTIRDDVDQDFAKRKVFDNWVATEAAMFKFQQVAKALQFAEGTSITSLDEFAKKVLYAPVRIKTKLEDYKGEPQTRISYYDQPKHAYAGGGAAADPFAGDQPIDISDDDLPF